MTPKLTKPLILLGGFASLMAASGCMTSPETKTETVRDTVHVLDTVILVQAKGDPDSLYGVWRGIYLGSYAYATKQNQRTAVMLSITPAKDLFDSTKCSCFAHFAVTNVFEEGFDLKAEGDFVYASHGILHGEIGLTSFDLAYSLHGDSLVIQQVGKGFLYTEAGVALER